MNIHSLLLACLFCWSTLFVREGESTIWVVGASTTVSLGGLIAGALLLKAGAAAVFGVAAVSSLALISP